MALRTTVKLTASRFCDGEAVLRFKALREMSEEIFVEIFLH